MIFFRKFFITITILFSLTMGGNIFSQFEGEGWRFHPQIGLWFGPVSPFPGTELSKVLDTYLGGGLFVRGNLPSNSFRTELGFSYSYYSSNTPSALHTIPIYGALCYSLPINLPLLFQVKAGGGSTFVRNLPEGRRNWLPTGMLGFETSFPAGKWVNIGLRIDYLLLYEKYLKAPASNPNFNVINGHFMNFGLMVNFNLSR